MTLVTKLDSNYFKSEYYMGMETSIKPQTPLDQERALAWIAQRLRWERALDGLRSDPVRTPMNRTSSTKVNRQAA